MHSTQHLNKQPLECRSWSQSYDRELQAGAVKAYKTANCLLCFQQQYFNVFVANIYDNNNNNININNNINNNIKS
jgi:hypothetical protein